MSQREDQEKLLSAELEQLLVQLYAPHDQAAVRALLLSYATTRYAASGPSEETDRIQFDLLHLGAGDAGKVRRLAEVATRDPRDVMSGEYFRKEGRSYPHAWARRHAVNRD
jgi:hypothetical protein